MDEQKQAAPAPAKSGGGDNDTLMGILAYLGILCLIPLLAAKDSKFAQYHAKQGLTLFIAEVVLMVLGWILTFIGIFSGLFFLGWIVWLLWIGALVLAIIGIVNVVNKEMKPLPLIGGIQVMK